MARAEGRGGGKKPKRLPKEERRAANRAAWSQAKSIERLPVCVEPHRGRSVIWSPELFDALCDEVAGGLTIKQACARLDVCEKTIRNWILDDRGADPSAEPPVPGACTLMRRALLLQTEAWADYLIQLADEATEDTIQLARFRSEQRKWLMGKNNARYNDKFVIAGDPLAPVQHEHVHELGVSDTLARIIAGLDEAARAKSRSGVQPRLVGSSGSSGAADSRR